MELPVYVLVTPAYNEAGFIELTIKSVVAQTVRPVKWVIVSDGSTDGTDDIVKKYASAHSWIELLRMPERGERSFAGKVNAFKAGFEKLNGIEYQVIGSMDADVSFTEDYLGFLLQKFAENPALGVAGTPFREDGSRPYNYKFVGIEHVSGACQLFRRECFESIGGYTPVKGGGIDLIAVVSARMKGWQTRTFTEKTYEHHRKMGSAGAGKLQSSYKYGVKDHMFGNHLVWQLFRIIYQMTRSPYVLGGLSLAYGYFSALAKQVERPVSREWVAFRRREQLQRLKNLFLRKDSGQNRSIPSANSGNELPRNA